MTAAAQVAVGALRWIGWMAGGSLIVPGARRVIFTVAAWHPQRERAAPAPTVLPSVLVLVTAWNERDGIEAALAALDRLEYPAERLHVTLVDHGSTDGTGEALARWAGGARLRQVLVIRRERSPGGAGGKSEALRAGLDASSRTDLVAVVDADLRLEPDALARPVAALSDPRVGAAGGYLRPRNPRGLVGRYAALETWVHQLVTAAAQDRLRLDPPLLGAWVVRRAVLDAIGGFPECATGEDVRIAAAIHGLGFRTRFCSTAIASNRVAATLRGYWRQHLRWARDVHWAGAGVFSRSARVRRRADAEREPVALATARRVDRLLGAAGYVDRLTFTVAVVIAGFGDLSPLVPAAYAATAALEIAVALHLGRVGGVIEALRVIGASAVMAAVDVLATLVAAGTQLAGVRRTWWRAPREG